MSEDVSVLNFRTGAKGVGLWLFTKNPGEGILLRETHEGLEFEYDPDSRSNHTFIENKGDGGTH